MALDSAPPAGERFSLRGRRHPAAADRCALHARPAAILQDPRAPARMSRRLRQRASRVRAAAAAALVAALLGEPACAAAAPAPSASAEDIRDIRGRNSVAPAWLLPALVGRRRRCSRSARYAVWRWRRRRRARAALLTLRDRSAAPRGHPRADAARERARILHRGIRHRSQLHRAGIRASPPRTEPPRNFCTICSNPRTQRSRAIARCWRSSCINATSSNSRACRSTLAEHGIAAPECARLRASATPSRRSRRRTIGETHDSLPST